MLKRFFEYMLMIIFAFLSALNYSVFIFPNKFAPAGIDGICTMIQDVSNISMGYLSLVV
ncbi:MAG: YitT family protein, partial [Clostridia bacterium]|nr:YitT family protein [Clostridia bacterium]